MLNHCSVSLRALRSGIGAARLSSAAGGDDNDITGTRTRRYGYDVRPSVHIRASTILGRCFARQGQLREATDAFETAIRAAERYGYKLLQLFGKLGVTQSMYPRALVTHDVAAPLPLL